MAIELNKEAYTKLIEQDILELNKSMPAQSLERRHIVQVLKWSIDELFPENESRVVENCSNPQNK